MPDDRRYLRLLLGLWLGLLAVVAAFNVVVDPFARNGRFAPSLPRQAVASVVDNCIVRLVAFRERPRPVILLGDSRIDALKEEYFAELGRPDVFNFAFGAGTLEESIDLFWEADRATRLRCVVIGVPFSAYNDENRLNRVPTARYVSRSLPAYYLSPLVTRAGVLVLASAVAGRPLIDQEPPMSREEFWRYQLGPGAELLCRRRARPVVLHSKLADVARRCRERGIELVFVVPPAHADVRALLASEGLTDDYAAARAELAQLGRVLDWDVPGPLTDDAANFDDPFHFKPEVARQLVRELAAVIPER